MAITGNENYSDVTFAIRGAPDVLSTGTLFVSGPPSGSGAIPLMMAAPPSEVMSLLINKTKTFNTTADLVINGSLGSGVPGASGMQRGMNLSMIRVPENFKDGQFNLALKSQAVGSGVNAITLAVPVGGIPQSSGDATIFVSGGITSAGGVDDNDISLVIANQLTQSGVIALNIEKGFNFSSTVPLQITSAIGSGDMSLVAIGVSGQSAITSLVMFDQTCSGVMPLYTSGFEE